MGPADPLQGALIVLFADISGLGPKDLEVMAVLMFGVCLASIVGLVGTVGVILWRRLTDAGGE